jgi:hypothetical protein
LLQDAFSREIIRVWFLEEQEGDKANRITLLFVKPGWKHEVGTELGRRPTSVVRGKLTLGFLRRDCQLENHAAGALKFLLQCTLEAPNTIK